MKKEITVILVCAFVVAMGALAIIKVLDYREQAATELSCQRRCEPKRWKILEEHCYCRELPDSWIGQDKQ